MSNYNKKYKLKGGESSKVKTNTENNQDNNSDDKPLEFNSDDKQLVKSDDKQLVKSDDKQLVKSDESSKQLKSILDMNKTIRMQILFSLIIYKKLINFNHNNIHQIFNDYREKNPQ